MTLRRALLACGVLSSLVYVAGQVAIRPRGRLRTR